MIAKSRATRNATPTATNQRTPMRALPDVLRAMGTASQGREARGGKGSRPAIDVVSSSGARLQFRSVLGTGQGVPESGP
jgi:hypothetical protein